MRQFVGVVLVKPDGSVLSQHRDNRPEVLGPDTWCVVGGAVDEEDEDLKATAVRELWEETGYSIERESLEILTGDIYTTERGVEVQRSIYWGLYDGRQPIKTFEGQEIRFITPTELGQLSFHTGHEGFLRMASETAVRGKIERKV